MKFLDEEKHFQPWCTQISARKGKGKARQGKARQGKAKQGKARQGKARQGMARQGKARQERVAPFACSTSLVEEDGVAAVSPHGVSQLLPAELCLFQAPLVVLFLLPH